MKPAILNGYKVHPRHAKSYAPGQDRWPQTLSHVSAEDMCTGVYSRGKRHCALGWAIIWKLPLAEFVTAYKQANETATCEYYNDNLPSHEARAQAVNNALIKLGYTEEA